MCGGGAPISSLAWKRPPHPERGGIGERPHRLPRTGEARQPREGVALDAGCSTAMSALPLPPQTKHT
eukprot:74831-Chlamydomonas_euryale.AAC.1